MHSPAPRFPSEHTTPHTVARRTARHNNAHTSLSANLPAISLSRDSHGATASVHAPSPQPCLCVFVQSRLVYAPPRVTPRANSGHARTPCSSALRLSKRRRLISATRRALLRRLLSSPRPVPSPKASPAPPLHPAGANGAPRSRLEADTRARTHSPQHAVTRHAAPRAHATACRAAQVDRREADRPPSHVYSAGAGSGGGRPASAAAAASLASCSAL